MVEQLPSTPFDAEQGRVVNILLPGVKQRAGIWRRAFPAAVAKEPLDYPFLARFKLTGAEIQNAALDAVVLARGRPAPDGPKVTMEHVLQAIRAEYRKLEKPVNEAEFTWQTPKAHAS